MSLKRECPSSKFDNYASSKDHRYTNVKILPTSSSFVSVVGKEGMLLHSKNGSMFFIPKMV